MSAIIRIVPYRESWPAEYQRLAERLRPVTPAGSVLHHIGSTAVPGLAAKDVIDIQLSVPRLCDVDIGRIERAGFPFVADRHDHQPPGAPLPPDELRKLYFHTEQPAAHLHVREHGRYNQRYAILCRDFLRANAGAAAAYAQTKIALAERFPADRKAYYAVKDPVVDLLMTGANLWAEAVSWQIPNGD